MSEQRSVLQEQILSGHPVLAVTKGDSMRPLLDTDRTQVLIVRADGPLKKGDLPLYRRPSGQFVMHRIIRVGDGSYYARGDNRCGLEEVPGEWVLGVVREITRKGRTFSVDARGYRAYVRFWNMIYPIRWAVYRFRSRIRRYEAKRS